MPTDSQTPDLPNRHRLIGYARLAPVEEPTGLHQTDALRAAGCTRIFEERQSETGGEQPVLTRLLSELEEGDTLVVTRLDRLDRSAAQLLSLIADLRQRGVHLRSLGDPVDTSAQHADLIVSLLASFVELQRSLMAQRSKQGLKAARQRGRHPGNPGLRQKDPDAIQAVSESRRRAYLDELTKTSADWLPAVVEMRPQHDWGNIVRTLNHRGQDWTVERLRRAVHRMVSEGMADAALLARAPRRTAEDRVMKAVAAIAIATPHLSLRAIAARLEEEGVPSPRGGARWQASSVRHMLDEAFRFGLIPR